MAINFPDSPSIGDTYSSGNRTWQWDGATWNAYGNYPDPTVLKIDPAANRIGINNTSPTEALDVTGNATVSGSISSPTITSIQSDVSTAQSNIGTLQSDVSTAQNNISTLQSDVSTAQSDISTAESNISTAQSDITTLETDVTSINELSFSDFSGTTYTLQASDAGKLVRSRGSSAATLTIPPQSSESFSSGQQILVLQDGAGQLTISPGSGVILRSKDGNRKLSAQYSAATLIRLPADDYWQMIGDLTA